MRAAVVESFSEVPKFGEFREPEPEGGEVLVEVKAAALSNLVRGQASGRHYSAAGTALPLVPGNDGVGVTATGDRVYFLGPRRPWGSMAERTVVARGMTITLPQGLSDVEAAALGNPALASWGALQCRAKLQVGEVVLVNGATGAAGGQAVQAAKLLGARWVIATGRNEARLEALKELGADEVIGLEQGEEALREVFRAALKGKCVNVVLDYLWGRSAELLLEAAGGDGGPMGEPRVRFVQVGSASGGAISLPGQVLRSSGVELLGSGLGSLSAQDILHALRKMYGEAGEGRLRIRTETVPLKDVSSAWGKSSGEERIVFVI